MLNRKLNVPCNIPAVSAATAQIEQALMACKSKAEDCTRAALAAEECMVRMTEAAQPADEINVKVRKGIFRTTVTLSLRGKEVAICPTLTNADIASVADEYGPEAEEMVRDLVLRASAPSIRYRYAKGVNVVTIVVSSTEKSALIYSLTALVAGVVAGVVCRAALPAAWSAAVTANLFAPLYDLFLAAVKMVVAPLVFFSIAASIAGFSDLGMLGRTAGKVFGCYLFTTMLALLLAIGGNAIIVPGHPGMVELPAASGVAANAGGLSVVDTIKSIVPDNFVGAFASGNMLQVIFIAVLVGIAAGRSGAYSPSIRSAIDALNGLFGSLTAIITRFLPFAIFGSIASMVAGLDAGTFGSLAMWAASCLTALAALIVCYLVLVAVMARLNPLTFIRKYYQVSLTGFLTSSSSAAIPISLDCCRRLGVSPRIYSFSIPLGANINMDGSSIFFSTATLFLAGLYGIPVEGMTMVTFVATVLLISVATPGVPGAGTACILLLFDIVGIPAEAFSLIIGIAPLLEIFCTAVNVTGDGVVATIVAKSEDALDVDAYNA